MSGRAHACAAAVTALAALAGCGSDTAPRTQVRSYLMAVNAAQGGMSAQFETANTTYVAFARGELEPDAAAGRLAGAADAIRAGRARVQAVKPPSQARSLHRQLLAIYDRNIALAEETIRVATYQRDAAVVLKAVGGYDRDLSRALARRGSPSTQARALRRFAVRLDSTLARLGALDPPPLLEPAHRDQIRRLVGARRLALGLRAALRAQDAERLARLLLRFRRTASSRAPRLGLTRRAVRDYNRRLKELRTADADLRRAQQRLDRALG